MPPKEIAKKPPPAVIRPPISDSSLMYIPEDAIEGYQERIETGIEWTLLEEAARYHKHLCQKGNNPFVSFSEAFDNKLNKSILGSFLDEKSTLTLDERWELLLPITLWDNDKQGNEEAKICFRNANCITDDLPTLIKKAVRLGNRKVLKEEIKMAEVLRVNDSQMTSLDNNLIEFRNLVTLNLCGNFISELDARCIPGSVRSLELQANSISSIDIFVEYLPADLLYLGLARNLFTNESIGSLGQLPECLTVLDLSNNDIYDLDSVLDTIVHLRNLLGLHLMGNPCSVCAGYARTTINRIQRLKWLDSREVLQSDRSKEPVEIHPDDLRAAYFFFTVYRVISAPMPPKAEKGAVTTFHIELEIPLLDVARRRFLMFRQYESLIEMMPPPEDGDWTVSVPSLPFDSKLGVVDGEASSHDSDIYNHLTKKNSREIRHYTTFESNRIQWNKVMNFQEPTVRIFCPDLVALRDTFRSVITVRLIYSLTMSSKSSKSEKKSVNAMKPPGEQRVTIATIKCGLKPLDWSQGSQHFHWDDSLGTSEAIHWGDGDLSVVQYSQGPVKTVKGKQEVDSRQAAPENLTCHFGFGIETLRPS